MVFENIDFAKACDNRPRHTLQLILTFTLSEGSPPSAIADAAEWWQKKEQSFAKDNPYKAMSPKYEKTANIYRVDKVMPRAQLQQDNAQGDTEQA